MTDDLRTVSGYIETLWRGPGFGPRSPLDSERATAPEAIGKFDVG
ncbi:hypothetical protein [Pseudooceanicola sp.]